MIEIILHKAQIIFCVTGNVVLYVNHLCISRQASAGQDERGDARVGGSVQSYRSIQL